MASEEQNCCVSHQITPDCVVIEAGERVQAAPYNHQLQDSAKNVTVAGGTVETEALSAAKSEALSEEAAAVTVQKVYRSYRTRRQLADCAIMNKDYAWWNVLEGALLRQSSETFYAYASQDTAARRWSRLKKKAAKVGKGLSKDENARKLAIQHWLEAIDPRHRYGHNLHFYYDVWEKSSTKEPFFHWLDVGEGKEEDLSECKRSKLQKQQIKYLGPKEREEYEVVVEGGKLWYKENRKLVNTPKGDKWIFVMSTSGRLYVAQKEKGTFQHSSFLAGGATKAAGRLLVNHGTLELMEAHSGHYHPTEENFNGLVRVLEDLGTDLSMAKVQSVSDDQLQKFPSGKNSEMNEEFMTKEFTLEGNSVHKSEYTLQELAGLKGGTDDNEEAVGKECDPLESQSSSSEQNASASMYGFHVHVLDRKASKISSQVEPKMEISSQDPEEEADVAQVPPAKPEGALKWTSEAGARIASLAYVPVK